MTQPRRRILRPTQPPENQRTRQRAEVLRSRLTHEQQLLDRWMTRLRRAFHAVEKQQRTIRRIERQLTPVA